METILGIDLGTTNSVVAVLQDGKPTIIEDGAGGILPSMVGLSDGGDVLVGEPAVNQMLLAPDRTVRSVKRWMGREETFQLGTEEYSPPQISAMILRSLKERAESHLGMPVRKAVITVPAFFDEAQRRATVEAGELAGLEVVRLLHEPTAASLAFDAELAKPRRLLAYDLGGGTFDVSIVEIQDGVVEVRASHGDTHLGGDDFDDLLLHHVIERFGEEHGVDLRELPRSLGRLRCAVERAKCQLSFQPYVRIEEEFIAEKEGVPLNLSLEVARHDYQEMIRPLIERTMSSMQTALSQAGLLVKDLDGILLVGGSTRTPLIREELQRRTGIEPRQEVHPDLCVALGAAVQAGMIAGARVDRVLLDITAHSFGVRCLDVKDDLPNINHYSVVIPRGSPLPTTRSEVYATVSDSQEAAEVEVYQGEEADVRLNTRIGTFRVEGLSEVPRGNPIVVQFHLTLDGTLTVTATEKGTGLEKRITIHRAGSVRERAGPASAENSRAVDASRRGAPGPDRAAAPPRLDPEEVQRTIARIRDLFDSMAPEDRDEAVNLIETASSGLAEGRLEEARKAHDELREILFYVEES